MGDRPTGISLASPAPEEAEPEKPVSTGTALEGRMPEGNKPEGCVPKDTKPEGTAIERDEPGAAEAEGEMPLGNASGENTPEGVNPDAMVPEGNAPAGNVPLVTSPEGSVPEGSVPEGALADATGGSRSKPTVAGSEETEPDEVELDETKSAGTTPPYLSAITSVNQETVVSGSSDAWLLPPGRFRFTDERESPFWRRPAPTTLAETKDRGATTTSGDATPCC